MPPPGKTKGGPLRVGVVGLGWFGTMHLAAWREVGGVEVAAVCDRAPERIEPRGPGAFAQDAFHTGAAARPVREQGPEPARYASVEEMLERERLDLLDVVVTEEAHAEVAAAGLRRGLDVVVEKPFVLSSADSRRLIDLASERGCHLYVGNVLRFDPRHVTLHDRVVASGRRLRHLSLQRHFQVAAHAVYGRVHPFFAACVHDLDQALWLTGAAPARVLGLAHGWLGKATPDVVIGILEWESGLRAVVQNSWHVAASCPYGFSFELHAQAEDATYTIRNQPDLEVWHGPGSGAEVPELFFWPELAGVRSGALVAELRHFAACARLGVESDRMPLAEAHAGIAVAEALVQSAHRRQWVEIGSLQAT